jgi:D-proline reductase (dithiol) PrdB
MPTLSSLPVWLRATLMAYPWRRIPEMPPAILARPLSTARVALVSSAGLVPPGADPFDDRVRGGDVSYRIVPGDIDVATLEESHRSSAFDRAGLAADRNVVFPLDRLRELAARGAIGEVAPRHLSFMGSITAPGRLIRQTAPEAAARLVEDGVEVALLVPV